LQENRITLEESQLLLQNYERSLGSYTYLSA
jgi:arginine decarboxylase